ncbi:hypothetical protein DXB61_05775 [Parabacteroides merdae]|jgi:hypothetical protein|uniref:RiboL-PSP-HEPN domain-containing protein n=1 Tax=Parabacteroides merdae TaxID=46503 RepID=A0AB37LVG2_9BACT|nr:MULTISPECIES: HEPN domain-containing protein [Bacteroidales]MCG0265038.1 hypothetical protein [Phocaeicola vulgatus]RGN53045.1 hypothetical protein DXB61_05775 [Parabacteroides merdae]
MDLTIEQEFITLQDYLLDIEIKYICPLEKKLLLDKADELDLRSYCVLSHAAFEEFAENMSLKVLDEITKNFANTKQISVGLIMLLHIKGSPEDIDKIDLLYDYILEKLKDIKSSFSKEIATNNHGVSLKYLKRMFIPIGIDIPNNSRLISSLDQLAKYRGDFAHKFSSKKIKTIPSPLDLVSYVSDITEMMGEIVRRVKSMHYFAYK